jgi:hypothetical protein
MPSGKQVLIGCSVGCLAFLVLGIGGCVAFFVWLRQPGELLEPVRLVGAETTGYAEWTLRLEDPGTEAVVESLVRASREQQERQRLELPSWLDALIARQQTRDREQLRNLFPMLAAWSLRPGADPGSPLHVFTVSIEAAGNRIVLLDSVLGLAFRFGSNAKTVVHRGERIYLVPIGRRRAAFFLRGNDVFIVSDVDSARLAVDRLAAAAEREDHQPTELERLLATLPGGPLRGVVLNEHGELERLWPRPGEGFAEAPVPWEHVRAATLVGGFAGETAFAGTIELRCRDDAAAVAPGAVSSLRETLRLAELPVEVESSVVDENVRIDFRVPDVAALLGALGVEVRSGGVDVRVE